MLMDAKRSSAFRRGTESLLAVFLILALSFPPLGAVAADKKPSASKTLKGLPITELSEEEAVFHALNRLAYGPRPGDVERARRLGLAKWIEQQLDPASINDSGAESRLKRFPTLAMSSTQLLEEFPQPQVAARRAGMTPEEYRRQQQEQARLGREQMQQSDGPTMPADAAQRGRLGFGRQGQGLADPNNAPVRFEDNRTPQRIIAELAMAKLSRAIYSERQLQEVLTDFWFNHFNVFGNKGADRWLITSYERDVIRPHTLGKFRDLLGATAQSPAMLFYLDNWQSADPEAFARLESDLRQRRARFGALFGGFGQQRPQQQRQRRGLNENYARELMELHTLGVDGGYTQDDIIQVARAFTGWTLRAPRRNPEFHFESRLHSQGPFMVLGHKFDAGGMRDGEQILDLLARHPSTARFISTKLARHFVSDNPPQTLVERMAKTFLATDGDIRSVLRAMFNSPEFWSRNAYRAKIKKPFELIASSARALGAEMDVPLPLVLWSARIGEPLYLCQPPTGYANTAETWVNTGTLLNRLNFSLALASGRMRGARIDVASLLGLSQEAEPREALDRAIAVLLAGQASPQTRATLEKQVADPTLIQASLDEPISSVNLGVVAGLVLGAPEFQRR